MNKFIKLFTVALFLCFSLSQVHSATKNQATITTKKTVVNQASVAKPAAINYTMLQTPTVVVANPYAYLNKNIEFPARFNKFSALGLDYRPAMRESQAYIGVLIERDDVGNNIIPLSEFKMFLKRADAEKLTDIETGDSILIKGKVFSTALGDPWMDITELKVLTQHKDKKTKN